MSPTYTYRCQHGHEIFARRGMTERRETPIGRCTEGAEQGVPSCDYELVMSTTADPVVKGGTPKHHG